VIAYSNSEPTVHTYPLWTLTITADGAWYTTTSADTGTDIYIQALPTDPPLPDKTPSLSELRAQWSRDAAHAFAADQRRLRCQERRPRPRAPRRSRCCSGSSRHMVRP
jgi:hypothetical protein